MLRPSRHLATLLIAVHFLTLTVLCLLPLVWWAKWAMACCVGASLAYYLARDAYLRLPVSCVVLQFEAEHCLLTCKDGTTIKGVLLARSTVMPCLLVLTLRSSRGSRSVLILPDAASQEALRELRVWLRWSR